MRRLRDAAEDLEVAHAVRRWALEHGDDPLLRIALCGYEGEHEMPASWGCVAWDAGGRAFGAGANTNAASNGDRERIWFSPACLRPSSARTLFGNLSDTQTPDC